MKVTYGEYLLSRQFNKKVYDKVKTVIERLDFNATAEFNMSAKTQKPMIIVRGTQNGEAADEIYSILNEYFSVSEPWYRDDDTTFLDFND